MPDGARRISRKRLIFTALIAFARCFECAISGSGAVTWPVQAKLAAKYMSGDTRSLTKWDYGKCPLASDPSHFGPFEGIVTLWRSRFRSDGFLPERKDFDFFDFKDWWGRVSIARIETEPFDIRFVLWGTQLTKWWGVDYTNKLMGSKSITPQVWKDVEGPYFRAMLAAPFIGVVSGSLDQHERPFIKVVGVDLPISDGEGGMSVLSVYVEAGQTDMVYTVMPDLQILEAF